MMITFKYEQILETIKALMNEYLNLLEQEDLVLIKYVIDNFMNLSLEEFHNLLLPIIEKVWNRELSMDKYLIISWDKYKEPKRKKIITFATLCEKNNIISFCDSTNGILYEMNFKALLGAHWKDGATIIEDKSKVGQYTIGSIEDKVINSYNGATKLITPKQLVRKRKNDYRSKHNELILDSRFIREIGLYEIER